MWWQHSMHILFAVVCARTDERSSLLATATGGEAGCSDRGGQGQGMGLCNVFVASLLLLTSVAPPLRTSSLGTWRRLWREAEVGKPSAMKTLMRVSGLLVNRLASLTTSLPLRR